MIELDMLQEKPDIRKILAIGSEGTGKTRLGLTLPKPIYCFSFDNGFRTLAGHAGVRVGQLLESDRKAPKVWPEFMLKFGQLIGGERYKWPDGREENYRTIMFDPLTFMSKALFDYVQFLNNNVDKKAGYNEYQLIKSRTEDILNRAVACAEYVYCTALLDSQKDELTGELFFVPNMVGSIREEVGAWFDAVFYMEVDKGLSGEKTYKMLTVGGRRHKAKIRVPSAISSKVAPSEEPDILRLIEKVNREWEAHVKQQSQVPALPTSVPSIVQPGLTAK